MAALSPQDAARVRNACPFGQPSIQRAQDYGQTYVVARDGYVLEEDAADRIPIWVCESVTKYQVTGPLTGGRISFKADPLLPSDARSVDADYKNEPYDRGHNAPLADQSRDQRLRDETFFLSNVAPQDKVLNEQAWAELEKHVRDWAISRDSVHVITGSFFWDSTEDDPTTAKGFVHYKRIGKDNVSVPTHFYKIVTARRTDNSDWDVIAFVMPNQPIKRGVDFTKYIQPVSWIEKRTGVSFFPDLPLAKRRALESVKASSFWPAQ
jgi:endonuclease G